LSPQGIKTTKPYNELPVVITGVYQLEVNLDRKYIFAQHPLVQTLLGKEPNECSGINFKLREQANEEKVRSQITAVFDNTIVLKNRREQNTALHRMLNTENLATYLIFTLVLIIALFNVVGAITMIILDKQQNSKTLFSLGTTIGELRQIYFLQGLLVTCLGGIIGVLIGALLIGSQKIFGWLKITPSLPYPVEFQFINVLIVLGTIIILGAMAAKIASGRISKKLIAP
ncbi:MAG: ABC transporter permease, partial [Flavobacteriaceae bacterium]